MSQTTITMLRNPAKSVGCSLLEGETGLVDSSLAEVLVRMKIAVMVEQPRQVHGIPDVTAIVAEEQPPKTEPIAKPNKPKP